MRGSHRGARVSAMVAVASIVVAWGVAQWDYILPKSLTIAQAAAPAGTLGALVVAAVLLVLIVVSSIAWLYRLDQQGLLPDEGVDDDRTAGAAAQR